MHPLLVPYSFLSLVLVVGATDRSVRGRSFAWLFAWLAMGLVLAAVIFREVRGDTSRYYATFLRLRELPLREVWAADEANWLFTYLNWGLGQLGTSVYLLIAPIAVVGVFILTWSTRRLFDSYHAALVIFIYSMYPFFIFYIASGLKQALAMAFLLAAYVSFFQKRRTAWVWLALAPLFHAGAVLAVGMTLLHKLTFNRRFGRAQAVWASAAVFTASLLLSFTGLNRTLLAPIQGYAAFDPSFDIYFQDAALFNYSAGFRLDFTAFSLAPVVVILILMYRRDRVTLDTTGWWISLYLLLASIYQLFSFAPFSDRFGAFAWSIIPIVVFIALLETHSRRIVTTATIAFAIMNVLMLQFYTGAVLLGA